MFILTVKEGKQHARGYAPVLGSSCAWREAGSLVMLLELLASYWKIDVSVNKEVNHG
jgi:hypothetical protein